MAPPFAATECGTRNRLYVGRTSVCKFGRQYHPETGARRTFETPEDAVERDVPDLRIIPDDLCQAVQSELARCKKVHGNPQSARQKKYLLSGILKFGLCGAPYVMANRTGYYCREARKGVCTNRAGISRKRIEARVFGQLRDIFRSEDMKRRFEAALEEERRQLAGTTRRRIWRGCASTSQPSKRSARTSSARSRRALPMRRSSRASTRPSRSASPLKPRSPEFSAA